MALLRPSPLAACRRGRALVLGLAAALAAACGSSGTEDDTSPGRGTGGSAGDSSDDDTSPAAGGSGGSHSDGGGHSAGGSPADGGGDTGGMGGDPTPEECAAGTWDHDASTATACAPKTDCVAGEHVADEGDGTEDRVCAGCSSGSFTLDANEDECTPWSNCAAGSRVTNTPSATENRACEPCTGDTYTSGENESECQPTGACAAGTVQTAPGSDTSPPTCATCDVGKYCAGGTSPAVDCAASTWDHDEKPSTTCADKTDCAPGEYVDEDGDAVTDRLCVDCVGGYSTTTNAGSCTDWTVCDPGEQLVAGTATADTVCKPEEWLRQFGTNVEDSASKLRVATNGDSFVFGTTNGALPGETAAGESDVFVRKYDTLGSIVWTTQLGTAGDEYAGSGALGSDGSLYYAGQTYGAFPGFTHQGSTGSADSFVAKLSAQGDVLWRTQFGTNTTDGVWDVTADGSGNLYVVGYTGGTFAGQTNLGSDDAFLGKLDSAGNVLWIHHFGSNSGDTARGVRVATDGHVYVTGYTMGALPTQTNSPGVYDAYLCKFDSDGNVVWARQFGLSDSTTSVYSHALALDGAGTVYIGGSTKAALPGQAAFGNDDAYWRSYDSDGNVLLTRQFGSNNIDNVHAIAVDANGNVVVSGLTAGTLPGQSSAGGGYDGFAVRYNAAGSVTFTRQFGTNGTEGAYGLGVDALGSIYVSGATTASFPGFTVSGSQDAYLAKFVP